MNLFSSIRLRLLLFSFGVTITALALAGIGLTTLFGRHMDRRISQELDAYIEQIAAEIDVAPDGTLRMRTQPSQPRFAQVYSGLYWQIRDEKSSALIRSRSLWDHELVLPEFNAAAGQSQTSFIAGPDGQELLLREQTLILSGTGEDRPIRISLGQTREDARILQREFARDLVPALAILAAVLLAGSWIQVAAGLRPITHIRNSVQDIRTGRAKRLHGKVPPEVEPLVSEVNTLLDMQHASMVRARDRAADLAHGLRTPLTALASDARTLRARGHDEIAGEIEAIATRMQRSVERELTRARARHQGQHTTVSFRETADAIARTLRRTPHGAQIALNVTGDENLRLPMDEDDLYEALGNLIENAVRAARSQVDVSARAENGHAVVTVEDDGANADPARMAKLTQRGHRDDEHGGAGLGLAIVCDVLAAYGSAPEFFRSTLGGLSVRFTIPMAARIPHDVPVG